MLRTSRLLALGATTAALTAALAAPASGLTLDVANPNPMDIFVASTNALRFTSSLGVVTCSLTMTGTIPTRSWNVVGGPIQIGIVGGVTFANCTPAGLRPVANNLPWALRFNAATVLTVAPTLFKIELNGMDFTILGTRFSAANLTTTMSGAGFSFDAPGLLAVAPPSTLTGTLGNQNISFGPNALTIR